MTKEQAKHLHKIDDGLHAVGEEVREGHQRAVCIARRVPAIVEDNPLVPGCERGENVAEKPTRSPPPQQWWSHLPVNGHVNATNELTRRLPFHCLPLLVPWRESDGRNSGQCRMVQPSTTSAIPTAASSQGRCRRLQRRTSSKQGLQREELLTIALLLLSSIVAESRSIDRSWTIF